MNRIIKVSILLLVCSSIAAVPSLWAEWIEDGAIVCSTDFEELSNPEIASDGSGGAIIVFIREIFSVTHHFNLYTQRIDGSGMIQWPEDGICLCPTYYNQYANRIISDGEGGAVVCWRDNRYDNGDIFAQRIDGSGSIQWFGLGIPLCRAEGMQYFPELISDGTGGAIIVWDDARISYDESDIYIQHVNGSGYMQWDSNGMPICIAEGGQRYPEITSDGAGGAIVAWQDERKDKPELDINIYAQRVSASGTILWESNGTPLCMADGHQEDPRIISDGSGGAIVTWEDSRRGYSNMDIYTQRIDASGTVLWIEDGVPVCTVSNIQTDPELTSDGAGGAIITWRDHRDDDYHTYIQRISASGIPQWTANGVPVCTIINGQMNLAVLSDGAGGAIVTWEDYRYAEFDIYAQQIDASGTIQWEADGIPLCCAPNDQRYPEITTDGAGGAIVTWMDWRYGYPYSNDIYAQMTSYVITGTETPETPHAAYLEQNYPNPFNPSTTIRFGLNKEGPVSLKVYDHSGRLVVTIIDKTMPEGNYTETWDGKDSVGNEVASGVYFYRLDTGSTSENRKMVLLR